MKYNKVLRTLALAVILSLLILAIPATPALAQTVDVSPAQGPVGETVTVTGINFIAGGTYEITFADGTVFEQLVAPTTTIVDIIFSETFNVPPVPRGEYTILTATSLDGDFPSTFTVTPQITLSPSLGYVGDQITVNGTGFDAGSTVTIYLDTATVGTATTSAIGSFANVTFTVPESCGGSYMVKGSDATGDSPGITFTTLSRITVTPTSGAIGDTVTISGTGFAASSPITFYLDDASVSADATTSSTTGSFTNNTFIIPSTSRGSHTIKAEDASANSATATFTVGQSITITPTEGAPGTTVTVTGTGFGASMPITIKYNGVTVTTEPASVSTDATGTFSASFSVPSCDTGTYQVEASDDTCSATADFIVEAATTDSTPPPIPSPLLPIMGGKTSSKARFDWDDVADPSTPVTYNLHIASDINFTTIVLEKTGLTTSEYTLTAEEKLEPATEEAPYYWRVRAIDGASNASGWTTPGSFQVGSALGLTGPILYAVIGIGYLLLFFLCLWISRRGASY